MIIKGLNVSPDDIIRDVEHLFTDYFQLPNIVSSACILGKNSVILAMLTNKEAIKIIMSTKREKLADTEIFVEHNLTSFELKPRMFWST